MITGSYSPPKVVEKQPRIDRKHIINDKRFI